MSNRMVVKSGLIATSALMAALSLASAAQAGADKDMEKCYGIAKAGKNDCASTGFNSCAGTAKADGDKGAWILVPKGTCDKLVNGSTTAPQA